MANDRETLEEISTWIRVDFHEICPWQAHGGRCAGCPLGGAGNNCIFDKIADKVDAAAKRERTEIEADALAVGGIVEAARKGELSKTRPKNAADFGQFGNAATKREAVVLALSLLDLKEGVPYKTISQKDIDFMKAALSAPARNCDRFCSIEQARAAYRAEVRSVCIWDGYESERFAKWLLEIAEVHHA